MQKKNAKTLPIQKTNGEELAKNQKMHVLDHLKKGLCASRIPLTPGLTLYKVYKIINELKAKKLITPHGRRPIFYDVNANSKIELLFGKNQEKVVLEEKKIGPYDLRIHSLTFKSENEQTHWGALLGISLAGIPNKVEYRAQAQLDGQNYMMSITRKDWNHTRRFVLRPPPSLFGGISSIRIFRTSVEYDFNRKLLPGDDYIAPSKETVMNFLLERQRDCEACRDWLNGQGLRLGLNDPEILIIKKGANAGKMKIHCETRNLKVKGLFQNVKKQLKQGDVWVDTSGGEGDGDVETNDVDLAIDLANNPPGILENWESIRTLEKTQANIDDKLNKIEGHMAHQSTQLARITSIFENQFNQKSNQNLQNIENQKGGGSLFI